MPLKWTKQILFDIWFECYLIIYWWIGLKLYISNKIKKTKLKFDSKLVLKLDDENGNEILFIFKK